MDGAQRARQAGQNGTQDDGDLGDIAGKEVEDELADVGVDDASLFDRRDDAHIIVIGQDHVGRFFGHIGPGNPHGHADISTLERGRIIDTVAGHGYHFIILLQRINDSHLVGR